MVFIYKKNVTEKSPKNCAMFSLSNLPVNGVLQSMTIKVNHNQCCKSYIIIAVIIADEFAHQRCIPIKLLSVITICPFQGMQCRKPPQFSDLVLLSFVLVFGPHSMKDKLKLGLLLQSVFSLPHFLFSGIQNIHVASFRMLPIYA